MSLHELLQALEQRLLDPDTRKDPAALDALLADDFLEFGSSGRSFTKSQIIAELGRETDYTPPAILDFKLNPIAPGVVLATYKSSRPTAAALRSSLWVERGGQWQMLFHQGTRIPG